MPHLTVYEEVLEGFRSDPLFKISILLFGNKNADFDESFG